ncbi:MAG: porin family protein [Alphaproteobacteria bacterium]|nr:MAG: porin family protein [Alphaproteobacteria bacterium]
MIIALASVASVAVLVAATPACAQGFRAEVHGGWDHIRGGGQSDDGIVYGIGAGYDFDLGKNVLLGVDLSADLSSIKDCEAGLVVANDETCLKARRDLAAAVRLGYKVSENGVVYALAGYSNARVRASYTTPAGVTTSSAANLDGLRLGIGYQQGFGGGAYGKIEYRYSNYESDVSRHQVLVGVGMAF